MDTLSKPIHYYSADGPALQDSIWIEQSWNTVRATVKNGTQNQSILILDEIQKIPQWSEVVKKLWDEDTAQQTPIKIVLLGSSPLLIQKGLSESLAGRFELIPVTHWSYTEMKEAFDFSIDQYIYFGGYPGAATLIKDEDRWRNYINESLIETTISRDLLLMNRIDKPALLRRLFYLGCEYSGQILSYTKMLGQLHDAGNTTTLSHYLTLLSGAGLITEIKKYAGENVRKRSSSPKLQVMNTGLMSVISGYNFNTAKNDSTYWGRLTESAVGAYLVNNSIGNNITIYYWRDRNREVDFIVKRNQDIIAIEVKSGLKKANLPGVQTFSELFNPLKTLLVGSQGIPVKEFVSEPLEYWF
jgi:hypothetical protein